VPKPYSGLVLKYNVGASKTYPCNADKYIIETNSSRKSSDTRVDPNCDGWCRQ